MRISTKVFAWLCVGVMGLGLQARAEEGRPESRPTPKHPQRTCGEELSDEQCTLESTERRQLVDDIFEYSFHLRVGPGTYDRITVHRVVREVTQGVPAHSQESVFLVHGDVWGFRGAFLASAGSAAVPRQQSFAIFLAQRGVDVWGIDLRWVNVPANTADFSFMKDWNLGLHAQDLGTGLAVARGVHELNATVKGGKTVLLGWSRGAAVSYAYLNEEAKLPPGKRRVSGFIPVDMPYKLAPGDEAQRQAACQSYTALAQQQAAGQYEGGATGGLLQALGAGAIAQPDAPSFLPGLTNRQAALMAGQATFALQSPAIIPAYHFAGGQFGADGLPTGTTWTRERYFYDFLLQASTYQSIGEQVDTLALWCGTPDVPYDDYLSQVKVPVLYVGAEGGFGHFGTYSTSLLGSTDVTVHLQQRFPAEARVLDYGHADLFLADDAQDSVWPRILDWMRYHD
ncbi:hypothetical protein JRI60_45085 [Archangium violaceum]|uniref:hypothetical protein n=1 Tax=Archangium violaceum TaxID=83451 RepID=UPI00195215EE|nr:hypothetical protein [Archangium violaceum]QRN96128.1 hypothetical protein JRI60_45085 [Archangium violaceum]